jgi:fumarate hydratase class I
MSILTLDGSGPADLEVPPRLEDWPKLVWDAGPKSRRVNLDTITADEIESWKPGDNLLLSGKMLTGRDAAHKRMRTSSPRANSCRTVST